MSLRSILVVIGVLIVIAILVDGYRHWRRAKQHENEMDKRSQRGPDVKQNQKFTKGAGFAETEPKFSAIEPRFFDSEPKFSDPEPIFSEPKLSNVESRFSSSIEPKFTHQEPELPDSEPKLFESVSKFDDCDTAPKFAEATQKLNVTAPKPLAAKSAPVKMPEPLPKKDKFIILHVLAEADTYFSGEALVSKFSLHKLHYGPMDIYHYYENDGYGDILFSVANAFEPGTLILDYPQGFYTQGLTFFIQLPGQCDTEQAFEAMLNTATLLAKSLNARLCDHQRQPLSTARVEQYRQEVTACNVI